MQISRGVYSEVPAQSVVWAVAPGVRGSVPGVGPPEGEPDEEGHLQPDHVHMLLSIPPKYAVAQVVGYLKGKNAIYVART
jgi:Transposase IS200 like